MAIVAVFDAGGMTAEQYNQTIKALEDAGLGNPDGRLYHVAASKDGGSFVVDVWKSEEQFNKFWIIRKLPEKRPVRHTQSSGAYEFAWKSQKSSRMQYNEE
jgi:hypothetical protein